MKNIENALVEDAEEKATEDVSIESVKPQETLSLSSEEQEVKKLHRQLIGFGHKALELAIQIGQKLQILKDKRGHGKWGDYVENILGIQSRTASNYLRLAANQEELSKSERFSDLSPSEALAELRRLKKAESAEEEDDSESSAEEEDFVLADGGQLRPDKVDWHEGLFDRDRVESRLSRMAEAPEEDLGFPPSRQQQVFLRLASGINTECGGADPEIAATLVRSALKEIEALLDELVESSSSESAAA